MDNNLTPKQAQEVYSSEGGSYHSWSRDEVPVLRAAQKAAAKLFLYKRGLALPSYSDSPMIAYILEGSGMAGIVVPEWREKVVPIRQGDAIALPSGLVTWWFNPNDSELSILLLGDTTNANRSGEFSNFQLTGATGIFTGFSPKFVSRTWDVPVAGVETFFHSQIGATIVKVKDEHEMPHPSEKARAELVFNCEENPVDVDVENGGRMVTVNGENLPMVKRCGFGGDLVKLDGKAMSAPGFSFDSALHVTYVTQGSGRVQVVGPDGRKVMDAKLSAGYLFVVPRYFVVAKLAGESGMQWFSIVTTLIPMFTNLAGWSSVWKALSPKVLQAALDVSEETEKEFSSKRTADAFFFPPP